LPSASDWDATPWASGATGSDGHELRSAIEAYIAATNNAPKPFVWVKSADQILRSIARFAQRTLDFHRDDA
jgi:hypothetical protein